MFESIFFSHIWVFALLPLPLLITLFVSPYPSRRNALKVSFMEQLVTASGDESHTGQAVSRATRVQKFMAIIVWLLVIIALSKPQLLEEPIIKELSQRDLLISIDLSGSMETRDFTTTDGKTIDRLEAVKGILNPFFEQRSGERIGLIFFGSAAFVQAPFTTDLSALQSLLNEAQVAMAGPQTVIGDSIAMAVKMFDESKVKDRLLILITDGNDTSSKVPPEEASKLAQDNKIKIISIAVGDPKNAGENPIDSKTLKSIAESTGGQFYYALDNESLKKVLEEINQLSPKKVQKQSYRPTTDLYIWPLLTALILTLLYSSMLLTSPLLLLKSRRGTEGVATQQPNAKLEST